MAATFVIVDYVLNTYTYIGPEYDDYSEFPSTIRSPEKRVHNARIFRFYERRVFELSIIF